MITYDFRIVLHSTGYGPDEQPQEVVYGVRKHTGTATTAMAAARRTRTRADAARIERVAVHGGPTFQSHEIQAFTIGLGRP
jgi:hypothetical protein